MRASGCDTDGLFEMFTQSARTAISHAQDEAREIASDSVGLEHLLVGLFSDSDGVARRVFSELGVSADAVRERVRERRVVARGSLTDARLSFSPEAKDALRFANRIAMGDPPGTEHILIALVARGENGACEILRAVGADPAKIRFYTKQRAWPAGAAAPGTRSALRRVRSVPLERIREIDFGD